MTKVTLTKEQKMAAYELVAKDFGLKWRQRDALDASPLYEAIMLAAHEGDLVRTGVLLSQAGII